MFMMCCSRPFRKKKSGLDHEMIVRQLRICPCGCFVFRWQPNVLSFSRTFFQLPKFPSGLGDALGNKRKEYSERRLLGYSMEQMFDIAADVEKYNRFVPWCVGSKIIQKRTGFCRAEMEIGFPPLVEKYKSAITLARPHLVKSIATESRLFSQCITYWKFSPGLPDNEKTCTLDFSVSFEFRTALYAHVSHLFFDELVKTMVVAFLKRAERLHGKSSIPIKDMKPIVLQYKS